MENLFNHKFISNLVDIDTISRSYFRQRHNSVNSILVQYLNCHTIVTVHFELSNHSIVQNELLHKT